MSCVPRRGHAHPPCASRLGLTENQERHLRRTCRVGRNDGCSGGHRENTQNRLPETLPEVFGENSVEHPEDYSGVSPGYTPKVGERRAKKSALCVGLPGDTLPRRQRYAAVSFLLRLDLRFPFPTRERPTAARRICETFSHPGGSERAGTRPPLPVCCLLPTLSCSHFNLMVFVRTPPGAVTTYTPGDAVLPRLSRPSQTQREAPVAI